ncbi:hypothetical protein RF11_14453 [Thelohanellus kitauei]|uniref:Uncharacterized protein n=1 Tax=Thelohanellus kitauei TaxID=669202 RepID=A0A0C2MUN5_THEKT|nr:hypothetical protein RF11_14453 [Thelohanellus kitauei]
MNEDRSTSLFGFTILTRRSIDDKRIIIVSAPGRKPTDKTYGGDFFKCSVKDLLISCESFLNNPVRGIIGIGTENVPFLFGVSMLEISSDRMLVCQAHRVQDIGLFTNCRCIRDLSNSFEGDQVCFINQIYKDTPSMYFTYLLKSNQ